MHSADIELGNSVSGISTIISEAERGAEPSTTKKETIEASWDFSKVVLSNNVIYAHSTSIGGSKKILSTVSFRPYLESTKTDENLSKIAKTIGDSYSCINNIDHQIRDGPTGTIDVRVECSLVSSTNELVHIAGIKKSTKYLGIGVSFLQMMALLLLITKTSVGNLNQLSYTDKMEFALLYYPFVTLLITGTVANELSTVTNSYLRGNYFYRNGDSGCNCMDEIISCFASCCPYIAAVCALPVALFNYCFDVTADSHEFPHEFLMFDERAWIVCQDLILMALTSTAAIIVVSSQKTFIEMLFNFGGVVVILSLDEVIAKLFQLEEHKLIVIEYEKGRNDDVKPRRNTNHDSSFQNINLYISTAIACYVALVVLLFQH